MNVKSLLATVSSARVAARAMVHQSIELDQARAALEDAKRIRELVRSLLRSLPPEAEYALSAAELAELRRLTSLDVGW